jgi:aerobic-type carbon monoxide dehydrogenase small subunit (CoxS/CutS family)
MSKISRRHFVEGTGAGLVVIATVPLEAQEPAAQKTAQQALGTPGALAPTSFVAIPTAPASHTSIKLTINGTEHAVEVEDHWTLVEFLRDHLQLTGTKIGCDRSECGACTVLVDNKPMYSCTQLAAWMDGRSILTVEGLSKNGKLDPLQQAFIEHDAPQCGFCTSGQLMTAKALLLENAHPTRGDVRHAMTGNLCRCSNYNHYVESVLAASGTLEASAAVKA